MKFRACFETCAGTSSKSALARRSRRALTPANVGDRRQLCCKATVLEIGGEKAKMREADDTESLELESAEPSSAIAIATCTIPPPSDPEINHRNENPPPNFYHFIIGSTPLVRICSSRHHNLGFHDQHILLEMH
jgi:hypothetical protein